MLSHFSELGFSALVLVVWQMHVLDSLRLLMPDLKMSKKNVSFTFALVMNLSAFKLVSIAFELI